MVIDTPANPADADHTYTVAPDGTVDNFEPELQGVISTNECAFRNGTGQVGDPVLVDHRRGTVEQFLFEPARARKGKPARPGGWKAIVSFADDAEPHERQVNPAETDLLLDEITREQKPIGEQTTAYGVPTDASFGTDDVKPAGTLLQLAVKLIEETEDFKHLKLQPREIAFFWDRKGGSSGGQPTLYKARFANKHEKQTNKWRLVITFSADVCRTLMLTQDVIEAMVHESLCNFDRDERGNLCKVAPDWRGFTANVERFGPIVPPARRAADVLQIEAEDVRNLRLDLDDEEDLDVGI